MSLKKLNKIVLLENGLIIDPYNSKEFLGDVLIESGKISQIGKVSLKEKAERINCTGKIITHGFCDLHVHFREPGSCLLYTSPSPRDATLSRMPSSA